MKLIIPMAGKGTRLRPHTHTTPKPLLPVAGTSIVERIIQTFDRTLERTIDEYVFVLGDFGDEVKHDLEELSGRHGAKATFYTQEQALGTAHAVYCAADSLDGEVIIVFADTLFDTTEHVSLEDADSVIWLKEVEDPSRFGVAVHNGDTITGFVEKPDTPISRLAIIGVYYFKEGKDLCKEIRYLLDHNVTGHGDEYQLTDALDRLLKGGRRFRVATVDEWLDCGTIEAWLETNQAILDKENPPVDAGKYPGSKITPPVYIGEEVTIKNSTVGPYTSIGPHTSVSDSTVTNSMVLDHSHIEHSELDRATVGSHTSVSRYRGTLHIGDHSIVKKP